jgi:TonB family protein
MTPAPAVARSKSDQPISITDLELLNVNICLWREVTDEVFEQHYRQRYFGNERISRQQAIDRLATLGANCLKHDTVGDTPLANGSGGPAAMPVRAHDLADVKIEVLPSRLLPWRSFLLSILAHGLIVSLLLSIKLPRSKRPIDFDTVTITYYKMSDSFPNVAPKPPNELSESRLESKPPAERRTDQEIRIRPLAMEQTGTVIEQPNVRPVSTLPKLQLPNVLLQTARMDPGREPLVVSADVLRHLAMDVQQPQALENLSHNSVQNLATRNPALPLPQIAAPAEPTSESLPASQIGGQVSRLQQRAAPLPFAAPPLEDGPAGFEVQAVPSQGPDLFVFSVSPAVPKGEIAVPKISSKGSLNGSPTQSVLPRGADEFSGAEVVLPAVSISSQTASSVIGAGTARVQAPLPKPPEIPKPANPARASSLLDFLPSRIPSSKPLVGTRAEIGSGESPLSDYESRGGPVYTAAINAPNFTSKRGSWIFRFAELSAEPASITPAASLTAPSAIVKVDPKYAPEVIREKTEGVVILFAVLRKDGTIDRDSIRIIRKLDDRLDVSARDALLDWRFKPSERNGIAVDIQMEVSIPFYFRKDAL